MNNLIIACSGASHSGKTTFMKTIKDLYPNDVVLLDEVIRDLNIGNIDEIRKCASKYLDLELDIIGEKINAEKSINERFNNKLILIDRSLVDSYFYYTFYMDKSSLGTDDIIRYHKFLSKLFDTVLDHVNNLYDTILFFKPIKEITRKDIYTQENIEFTQENEYNLMSIITDGVLVNKSKLVKIDILKDQDYLMNMINDVINKMNEKS